MEIIIAAIKAKMPDTHYCICLFHINQNFIKQLKGKLGSSFSDFIKDFYKARNSLKEEQFNERYFKMISFFIVVFIIIFSLLYMISSDYYIHFVLFFI